MKSKNTESSMIDIYQNVVEQEMHKKKLQNIQLEKSQCAQDTQYIREQRRRRNDLVARRFNQDQLKQDQIKNENNHFFRRLVEVYDNFFQKRTRLQSPANLQHFRGCGSNREKRIQQENRITRENEVFQTRIGNTRPTISFEKNARRMKQKHKDMLEKHSKLVRVNKIGNIVREKIKKLHVDLNATAASQIQSARRYSNFQLPQLQQMPLTTPEKLQTEITSPSFTRYQVSKELDNSQLTTFHIAKVIDNASQTQTSLVQHNPVPNYARYVQTTEDSDTHTIKNITRENSPQPIQQSRIRTIGEAQGKARSVSAHRQTNSQTGMRKPHRPAPDSKNNNNSNGEYRFEVNQECYNWSKKRNNKIQYRPIIMNNSFEAQQNILISESFLQPQDITVGQHQNLKAPSSNNATPKQQVTTTANNVQQLPLNTALQQLLQGAPPQQPLTDQKFKLSSITQSGLVTPTIKN